MSDVHPVAAHGQSCESFIHLIDHVRFNYTLVQIRDVLIAQISRMTAEMNLPRLRPRIPQKKMKAQKSFSYFCQLHATPNNQVSRGRQQPRPGERADANIVPT